MVALNRRNGGVQLLLILAAAISLALAAPSFKKLNERRQKLKNKILSTTTTTPAPHTNATSCEEMYRDGKKNTFDESVLKDEIKNLMNRYENWGILLDQAPVAIATLGKLIIMSNQKLDFPIDESLPTGGFKHIKYPNSFRTTLLQISHDGYLAFFKAHTNMDKIRMYNLNVPSHIKDITRFLMSKKQIYIDNLLPISLGYIKKAADQSKELSQEVMKEFENVTKLIHETIEAATSIQSGKEIKLSEVVFDIDVSKISHEFSQNETKLLEEKKETLSKMLLNFDYRQKNILVRTIYGNEDFVINLSKEWLSQTEGRHEKHDQEFFGKGNWIYNYTDERVEADLCLEQNNQHLLELIINMGQYRLRYEKWQKSSSKENFDATEDLVKLETGLKDLTDCSTVQVIVTKFAALIKRLQNVKFYTLKKNSARPAEKEMNELILVMNKLRSETKLETKEERKSTTDGYTNLNLIQVWRKNHLQQLGMLNSIINATEDIVKINNQQLDLRRRKTEQVLDKLKSLDITKTNLTETIRALKEGLVELRNLKRVWSKLMDFYSRMSTFMDAAAMESMGLIEYLNVPIMNPNIINDDEMFSFFLEKMEKANEASFLVHQISDMYVNVSDAYIMTRMASLDKMVDPHEIHNLTQYQEDLIATTKNDSENILKYVSAHETSLKKGLVDRHNQIMDEYQWVFDCRSSEDKK